MKKRTNFLLLGLIFLSCFFFSFPLMSRADEQSDEVTIILHKRVWIDQAIPENLTNTGLVNQSFGGTPLADVSFTVYDATEVYDEASKQTDFQPKEWITEWAKKSTTDIQEADLPQIGEMQTTNDAGEVTFVLPQGSPHAYLFVQKPVQSTTLQFGAEDSAPLMIVVPYYPTDSSNYLKTIHIYLKNAGTRVTPTKPSETPETPNTKQPTTETSIWNKLPNTGQAKSAMAGVGLCILAFGGWLIWHKKQGKNETDNQGGNQK
ncbi:pilin N-terminal domain-containing protein [Enterococcus italicus]|uniref:pilin N-terminal domain-containing protein n=1 Tax=Enterococcus italicus TaxID=246144 RepID=UPI0028B05BB7|nr:pilin N-terminal domain-containing protein [Enterococcus italicus]